MRRVLAVLAAAALSVPLLTGSAAAAAPPPNPALGPVGTAAMHSDAASSDTTPYDGPGTGPITAQYNFLFGACPTVLQGSDQLPQLLCTSFIGLTPTVHLLDPATGASVAELALTPGNLLGGVYAFVDNHDQMVVMDGTGDLLRVGHDRFGPGGAWRLFVAERIPIQQSVSGHCGGNNCDSVTSLMADYSGRVWFATARGAVGYFDPATNTQRAIVLPGERVANSISTAPEGVSVATDHALYQFRADPGATPTVVWRQPYDRGPARKPGQLSWGTGASPTFFGPSTGTEYLTITDNAVPKENLLVYRTDTGVPICSVPAVDGTENSPIGAGNSVFVASTYGYPYPRLPEGAGPSQPDWAPFVGGMTRIDVDPGGTGCHTVWTNPVRSAAVPKLSTAENKIYTTARRAFWGDPTSTGLLDFYDHTVIDAATGAVRSSSQLGLSLLFDSLQTAGLTTAQGVQLQGTLTGVVRIADA